MTKQEAIKAAKREATRQWAAKNPDKVKAYQKRWRERHPEKYKLIQNNYWLRRAAKMGFITEDELKEKLN